MPAQAAVTATPPLSRLLSWTAVPHARHAHDRGVRLALRLLCVAIEIVSFVLADAYPTVWPIILGVLLLVVILFRPSGLISLLVPRRASVGIFRVAARRPRRIPKEADDGAA